MITTNPNSLKVQLNGANPNTLADGLRKIKVGDVLLQQSVQTMRAKEPAASPYSLAAVEVVSLPDDAKAGYPLRAYAKAGTGTIGELAKVADYATPAAGQFALAPNGDIAFAAADAWDSVDVSYVPEKQDVAEAILPVTADVMTLSANLTTPGVVSMLEVESLVGTLVGKLIVLAPGSTPASGQAALSDDKLTVVFNAADAVTNARVKLGIASAVDLVATLEAASATI